MTESFRLTLIKSFLWKFLEARAVQIITLVSNIILARFLLPEAFGTVAILTAIFYLIQTFIDEGLSAALVQKSTIDEVEASSVFYLQLTAAAVLYAVLFFISPEIGEFYQVEDMTLYLRITGLFLFFYAFQSIQYVFINREFKFRKYFFCSLASSLIAGGLAVCMIVNGCGIWSVVLEEGVYAASLALIMWFAVKWRPKLTFSWEKVKKLYAFGWRVLLASLAIRLSSTSLIGGKFFSTEALGNYTTGESYPKTIARIIYEPVNTVVFPAIAKCQDAKETRIKLMHYVLICNVFILFPLMGGIAAMAEPLVHVLLGENWTGAIFFIQLFTIVYAAAPMMYLNLQTIKGLGKGGKYLFAQMLSFVLVILVFVFAVQFGIYAIAVGMVIATLIKVCTYALLIQKQSGYSLLTQIKDQLPVFLITCIAGGIIYCFTFLPLDYITMICMQIPIGLAVYLGLAWLFRLEAFTFIIDAAKELLISVKEQLKEKFLKKSKANKVQQ